MHDGEVHRKAKDGRISIVKFLSYAFDLSSMAESTGNTPLYASDRTLSDLLNPDPTDTVFTASPGSFRSELHRRFSDWLLPVVFALVSLVIAGGARSSRRARLHPMVSALIICFALRWMLFYVTNLTKFNAKMVPLVYAVPLTAAAIAIFMLMTNTQIQMPRFLSSFLAIASRRVRKQVSRIDANSSGGSTA
jgi:lipopolysaccharide export system permease protein